MASEKRIYKILSENNRPSATEIRTVTARDITTVLLEARVWKGITREDLGEVTGIHFRSFENWELRHTNPRIFDLEVWSNALEYDLFFLLVPRGR